jgi:hypothetical protein
VSFWAKCNSAILTPDFYFPGRKKNRLLTGQEKGSKEKKSFKEKNKMDTNFTKLYNHITNNILNKDNILIFGSLMVVGTLAKYGVPTMNLDEQHLAALAFILFTKLFPRRIFPKLLFTMYMMPGVSNMSGSGDLADCSPDDVIEKNIWYGLDREFLQAGRVNEKMSCKKLPFLAHCIVTNRNIYQVNELSNLTFSNHFHSMRKKYFSIHATIYPYSYLLLCVELKCLVAKLQLQFK